MREKERETFSRKINILACVTGAAVLSVCPVATGCRTVTLTRVEEFKSAARSTKGAKVHCKTESGLGAHGKRFYWFRNAYQSNIGLHLPTPHVRVIYDYRVQTFLKRFFSWKIEHQC